MTCFVWYSIVHLNNIPLLKNCVRTGKKGWIAYGIHPSDSALMTCQFDAFADGKHMHFIDGGNGGYAMAAKGLKITTQGFKGQLNINLAA